MRGQTIVTFGVLAEEKNCEISFYYHSGERSQ